jgi:ADP-ribose pyrophosphatase
MPPPTSPSIGAPPADPDLSAPGQPPDGNPWTTLASRERYDNPWIRVTEHDVLNPAGRPALYGTVHFKHLAIGILPVAADGSIYLVGQFRYPLERFSWEIPEGGGALDLPPLASAERELLEETGLVAANWQEILRLDLSNSVTDEHAFVYLAWGLEQGQAQPDETERLHIRRLPFAEALAMVSRGEITDAISVASLLKFRLLSLTGDLPEALRGTFG